MAAVIILEMVKVVNEDTDDLGIIFFQRDSVVVCLAVRALATRCHVSCATRYNSQELATTGALKEFGLSTEAELVHFPHTLLADDLQVSEILRGV